MFNAVQNNESVQYRINRLIINLLLFNLLNI